MCCWAALVAIARWPSPAFLQCALVLGCKVGFVNGEGHEDSWVVLEEGQLEGGDQPLVQISTHGGMFKTLLPGSSYQCLTSSVSDSI
ncbi:hypothetical protein HBI56_225200 [Parastagonospora nodorum]|uniref:Uncharacterized protein n=1 Tax=Phaeosphaeria nodorum (strain SN15 / ATCC MYA-4574 / FGSC 10173) TaxID=321614 RepID=A0A7U2NRE9_PHANO|nr:hypothetical protein HBH56_238820 [Parastagonospora nodorum]QRD07633.1 hypothetical protein JI435_424680 [Parastagonospora nodorum SN15]KAH3921649.1 hypothetical protein HBH54_237210 [Parastagonospora nodorum]KAH3939733.1 hypothetical protein HBH53_229130 [Parastagonospora nodorum]KAH3957868.1 hypothetical protein HBH51_217680 [Parastagonospora nodorum]